jgi:SAM-dependent methyltransferase
MKETNVKNSHALSNSSWINDNKLVINNVNYHLTNETKELQDGQSSGTTFLLGKTKRMVEKAAAMAVLSNKSKIFEIGILHGGSVALYDQLFRPEKIVAIEHVKDSVQTLAAYIKSNGKEQVIKPYFGINQADAVAMRKILEDEYSNKDIDFIFDDGAHLYYETRAAFNICFPYLKPGGLYCIEDWGWAHWPGDYWQKGGNEFLADKTPMSNLIVELMLMSASRPDLIENIIIDGNRDSSMVIVKRGIGELECTKFDIAHHTLTRGQTYVPCEIIEETSVERQRLLDKENMMQLKLIKVREDFQELTQLNTKCEQEVQELTQAKVKCEQEVQELTQAKVKCEQEVQELTQAKVKCEQEVQELTQAKVKCEQEVQSFVTVNKRYKTEIVILEAQFNEMLRSTSWKITHPLRQIKTLFSK